MYKAVFGLSSALLVYLFASLAGAASFDCAKAARPVDKLICSDPKISMLDEHMAQAYQSTRAASPGQAEVLNSQREWLKRRDACANSGCLGKIYQDRISLLQQVQKEGERATGIDYAMEDLAKGCLPQESGWKPDSEYRECALREVKPLGRLEGKEWYAADYCLAPADMPGAGCGKENQSSGSNESAIMVFVRERAGGPLRLRVRYSTEAGSHFHGAEVYSNAYGTLLDLSVGIEGTGNINGSGYFLFKDGNWRLIDFDTWQKDLQKRLPKGLGVWKGPWPDLKKMAFDSPLWKEGDGNCCPTGGNVHVKLGLDGERLAIRTLRVGK